MVQILKDSLLFPTLSFPHFPPHKPSLFLPANAPLPFNPSATSLLPSPPLSPHSLLPFRTASLDGCGTSFSLPPISFTPSPTGENIRSTLHIRTNKTLLSLLSFPFPRGLSTPLMGVLPFHSPRLPSPPITHCHKPTRSRSLCHHVYVSLFS